MKKIILLSLISSSILFSGDIFDDLKKKEVQEFNYLNKTYPIDKTCSTLDLKKFLLIQEELLLEKKSKRFFLDVCEPFKKLYNLNKKVYERRGSKVTTRKKYEELIQDYRDSFYINYYAYSFMHKYKGINININYDIFKIKDDDFSKYVNIYSTRKLLDPRLKKKENYLKKVNKKGRGLLSSVHNSVYLNVSEDLYKYTEKYEPKKKLDFLLYRIKENKRRKLNNKYLYMKLATYEFNRTYLKEDFNGDTIKKIILKSYKEGELESQTKLYVKLDIRKNYYDFVNNYPEYIQNVAEYDMLMKEIEKLNRYAKIVNKDYYYLAMYNAFVYEKMIYLKKKRKYFTKLYRSLKRAVKTEPDFKQKRIMKDKIEELRKKDFFTDKK